MTDLKLYVLELGWAGGRVVVATSKEEALEVLRTNGDALDRRGNEISASYLVEVEITPGEVIMFHGDS